MNGTHRRLLEELMRLHVRLVDDSGSAFTVTSAPEKTSTVGRSPHYGRIDEWSDGTSRRWTVRVREADVVRTAAGEAWIRDWDEYERVRHALVGRDLMSREDVEREVEKRFGVADASRFFDAVQLMGEEA